MSDTKYLVIVESPTKTKKLSKFLGSDYIVKSSVGHITDLPKSKSESKKGNALGVDEVTFEPEYILDKKKADVAKELKKLAKKSDIVILATDEDREGEAIGWHVARVLNKDKEVKKIDGKFYLDKVKNDNGENPQILRVTFNSITKKAILDSFNNPRNLNFDVINAQQARRVLDRLVGYKLSPLLWSKIRYGLSAGRVQSVATRLIVEREKEIKAFPELTYYEITGQFSCKGETFDGSLTEVNGQSIYSKELFKLYASDYTATKTIISDNDTLDEYKRDIKKGKYTLDNVSQKETKTNPSAPFTTSSLQQTASTALGFSPKNTMRIAQKLYENGYITYMRTDSNYIIPEVVNDIREMITNDYTKKYLNDEVRQYMSKTGAITQDAHEAVRPTDCNKKPSQLPKSLGENPIKLYTLIWQRTVASQMSSAVYLNTTFNITSKETKNNYLFKTKGSVLKFDGYTKVYKMSKKDTMVPNLSEGQNLALNDVNTYAKTMNPPPRYNESSLVKELEKFNIGRPSTYASIISTVQSRGYVKNINKVLYPTDNGFVVNKLLSDHFEDIVDIDFTANMEKSLDEIAEGKKDWKKVMHEFYDPFKQLLEQKKKTISKEDYVVLEKTEESCPECSDGKLILKLAKYGKFYSCDLFPDCTYGKPFLENDPNTPQDESLSNLIEELEKRKCPDCGNKLMIKQGRYGNFIGCSSYPDCRYIEAIEKKIGMKCPKCNEGEVIAKNTKKGNRSINFYGCNQYPDCDFLSNKNPLQLTPEELKIVVEKDRSKSKATKDGNKNNEKK